MGQCISRYNDRAFLSGAFARAYQPLGSLPFRVAAAVDIKALGFFRQFSVTTQLCCAMKPRTQGTR